MFLLVRHDTPFTGKSTFVSIRVGLVSTSTRTGAELSVLHIGYVLCTAWEFGNRQPLTVVRTILEGSAIAIVSAIA